MLFLVHRLLLPSGNIGSYKAHGVKSQKTAFIIVAAMKISKVCLYVEEGIIQVVSVFAVVSSSGTEILCSPSTVHDSFYLYFLVLFVLIVLKPFQHIFCENFYFHHTLSRSTS
jgi:hypothetical protein